MISIICAVRSLSVESNVFSNLGDNKAQELILIEGKSPSFQRNAGVNQAKGTIIYFIDDDSKIPSGLLLKAAEYFEKNPQTAVLGGPELTPDDDSLLQKSFGAVFGSFFAAGSSSARYKKSGKIRFAGEKELILCNMFVRKDVFDELKGFNEKLYPNEENEFLNRVQESGYKIVYNPELYIYRSKRRDYISFIKQCFSYGKGRAEQAVINFNLKDLINFVPAFFLAYILSELTLGGADWLPFIIYLLANAVFSFKSFLETKNAAMSALVFINFIVLHLMYGAGSIYGLAASFFLNDRVIDTDIKIKKSGIA